MVTNFRWYINGMDVIPDYNGYSNFVSRILWRYNASTEDGYNADITGQLCFNEVPDPYIDYYSITEAQVIDWLNTYQDVIALQEKLDQTINEIKNPAVVNLPLPWEQPI